MRLAIPGSTLWCWAVVGGCQGGAVRLLRFHKWFHLTHCYRVGVAKLGCCKVVARGVYWVFHTAPSHSPYDILVYDIVLLNKLSLVSLFVYSYIILLACRMLHVLCWVGSICVIFHKRVCVSMLKCRTGWMLSLWCVCVWCSVGLIYCVMVRFCFNPFFLPLHTLMGSPQAEVTQHMSRHWTLACYVCVCVCVYCHTW